MKPFNNLNKTHKSKFKRRCSSELSSRIWLKTVGAAGLGSCKSSLDRLDSLNKIFENI